MVALISTDVSTHKSSMHERDELQECQQRLTQTAENYHVFICKTTFLLLVYISPQRVNSNVRALPLGIIFNIKMASSISQTECSYFRVSTRLVPCPNVGQASTNHDLRRGLFFLYCYKFASFSHLKSRLLTTGH